MIASFARQVRLSRLFRHADDRLFVVPLDHSVHDGPLRASLPTAALVSALATRGVDAVVLHKGTVRHIDPQAFRSTSLILHLSASTSHAGDPDAKYLVASVEEALSLGADAVSIHVNLGSADEGRQVQDMSAVAQACDRWNLPLLAMIYPRGPRIDNPAQASLVAHAVSLAVDLGADIVKTVRAESDVDMKDIVAGSPIPVIVAGGHPKASADATAEYVSTVLATGAAGVAMGRNIFQANDPAAVAARIARIIHPTGEHYEDLLA
jgi:2-amino-4,5-dihydroxy-6-oxo-7-(phosphonooxy)heptanoate synthase